jgi:hypothetical protein
MIRIILVHGLVGGLVILGGILATIVINGEEPHANVWLGYLIMLLGLSAVLVGVKQYRDQVRGGVIGFLPALGVGLAIAGIASLAYVAAWEAYLAMTDYAFMGDYVRATLEAKRAEGVSGEAYAKLERELAVMTEQYRSPLFRLPMTFVEIFPVGLLTALVSAGLLRNSRFLPAKVRT